MNIWIALGITDWSVTLPKLVIDALDDPERLTQTSSGMAGAVDS